MIGIDGGRRFIFRKYSKVLNITVDRLPVQRNYIKGSSTRKYYKDISEVRRKRSEL